MKVNLFETHDRFKHLMNSQAEAISRGCDDCLKRNPLSLALQQRSPYVYIFAHPRKHENEHDTRMLWQPRLSKPAPQTNSYLFRAKSHTDILEICWQIPPREMWSQYRTGNVTECQIANWSIHMFQNFRKTLESPYEDDLNDEQIRNIYDDIRRQKEYSINHENMMERLYDFKPSPSEASLD